MQEIKRNILKEDVRGIKEVAYTLLEVQHPLFVEESIQQLEESIALTSILTEDMYDWDTLYSLTVEEKLRHLINCGNIYTLLKDEKYTYQFAPKYIVFTINGLPKLISRGIKGQVAPYEYISGSEFLMTYQAMIISLLDTKADYALLNSGKLPFYKGDLFCEAIAKATTLADVLSLLNEKYIQEKIYNKANYAQVRTRVLSRWKISTILATIIATISLAGVIYLLAVSLPSKTVISDIRLAFIQQDYSKVITTAKTVDSKALSQNDKYIVAYSVIMSEPLTEAQKKELSRISTQTSGDYLRYWVLIGQSRIDEAIDIASFLDDPQLLMYGLTKKIDDIQRDPDLKSEERTEKINSYKAKLDELKKKYLTPLNDEANTEKKQTNGQ